MPLTVRLLHLLVPTATGLAIACGGGAPDASRLADALDARLSPPDAIEMCESIGNVEVRDECVSGAVRLHAAELDGRAADVACGSVTSPRWAGECWFTLAESRGDRGQRFPALEACGRSGPFHGECLYHLWTNELNAAAKQADDAAGAVDLARDSVEFWSGIETIAGDPRAQINRDLWFFAHNEHRPADVKVCEGLPEGAEPATVTRAACVAGTRSFVLRAVTSEMIAPGQPSELTNRVCRSQEIPSIYLNGVYTPDPRLEGVEAEIIAAACRHAAGERVRTWNPVFQDRPGAG